MTFHILLVEDDDNLRDVLARSFQRAGYRVSQAADGQQAIAMLEQASAPDDIFEVVVTDIIMGEIDGVEVMHTAKRQDYSPEVLLLTGHASLNSAIEAVRTGAFDYLQKPCRVSWLLERVQQAIEHRQTRLRQAEEADALRRVADVLSRSQPAASGNHDGSAPTAEALPAPTSTMSEEHAAEDDGRYLSVGGLQIDTYRHDVVFQGQSLHMTPTEYALLACLATTSGRVVTYSDIAAQTHSEHLDDTDAHELLRWHVRNLRHKLDRRYLVSVRGVGYMLIDPDEEIS
jgi:DNA-binding response OmpR family regulator